MNVGRSELASPKLIKVVAAVVVGLGAGALLPPDPVTLPVVGTVPGVVAGAVGVAVGGALYRWGPGVLATPDCGCAGDCDCS